MTNARFASNTVDPEDTASSLRAKGRVLGFEHYIHPRLASLSVRKGRCRSAPASSCSTIPCTRCNTSMRV